MSTEVLASSLAEASEMWRRYMEHGETVYTGYVFRVPHPDDITTVKGLIRGQKISGEILELENNKHPACN